ncbi:hypothetical protein DFQ26_002629 [Actinomortierella ambigua]|nr:hypothetical protein DFQ26_002629 [Actinomortierella ambigua]
MILLYYPTPIPAAKPHTHSARKPTPVTLAQPHSIVRNAEDEADEREYQEYCLKRKRAKEANKAKKAEKKRIRQQRRDEKRQRRDGPPLEQRDDSIQPTPSPAIGAAAADSNKAGSRFSLKKGFLKSSTTSPSGLKLGPLKSRHSRTQQKQQRQQQQQQQGYTLLSEHDSTTAAHSLHQAPNHVAACDNLARLSSDTPPAQGRQGSLHSIDSSSSNDDDGSSPGSVRRKTQTKKAAGLKGAWCKIRSSLFRISLNALHPSYEPSEDKQPMAVPQHLHRKCNPNNSKRPNQFLQTLTLCWNTPAGLRRLPMQASN